MNILDCISRAGKLHNEDLVEVDAGGYALVLDGSSGLRPNTVTPHLEGGRFFTDAQWLVAAFARHFSLQWASPLPLSQVVDVCLEGLAAEYAALPIPENARHFFPTASLAIYRAGPEVGELFLLGDCTAILSAGEQTLLLRDPAVSRLDGAALALGAARAKADGCTPAQAMQQPAVRELLRSNRSKANRPDLPDWYGVLAPLPGLAQYGLSHTLPLSAQGRLLLLTDGLAAYHQVYGLTPTPKDFLARAETFGLARLLDAQRALEEADPEFVTYLRLKKCDDASGVLLAL